MSLGTILLIIVLLMLVGAIPTWPHSNLYQRRQYQADAGDAAPRHTRLA